MNRSRNNLQAALAEVVSAAERGDAPAALALAQQVIERELNRARPFGLPPEWSAQTFGVPPQKASDVLRLNGGRLARQGLLVEAEPVLAASLAVDASNYATLIDYGTLSFQLGKLDQAELSFGRAATLRPDDVEPLGPLAAIAARRQRPKEARTFAERALALKPDLVTAHLALARSDFQDHDYQSSVGRLTDLLTRGDLPEQQRVAALDLRAEAFDGWDRCKPAFDDYTARNLLLKAMYEPTLRQQMPERRIDQVRRIVSHLSTIAPEDWSSSAGRDHLGAQAVRKHVFLMGFPRSGTTLLEKALAGHPDIQTLEEVDCLAEANAALLGSSQGLQKRDELTEVQAEAYRSNYWNAVHRHLAGSVQDKVLIDKLPLHTIALPVIAKLFPQATILFALRDPRDVVLSCFRRRFLMNASMFEFLSLESAAAYYDRVMMLARLAFSRFHLIPYFVRHESLVSAFDTEMQQLLAALGLEWRSSISNFSDRAQLSVRTPSDLQLQRGLSTDGIGQWRRYADSLKHIVPIISPWVSHFQYKSE